MIVSLKYIEKYFIKYSTCKQTKKYKKVFVEFCQGLIQSESVKKQHLLILVKKSRKLAYT